MAYLFSYLGATFQTKNKLEADVLVLLKKNDRKVMYAKEGAIFLKNILRDIKLLNELHPRCTSIEATVQENDGDFQLYGIDCGVLSLYKSSN